MSLFRFVVAMILLAGWGLAALSLYVVRTAGGVQVVTKNKLSLVDTYIDVRHWNSDDEEKHSAFYARVQQLNETKMFDAATAEVTANDAPAVEERVRPRAAAMSKAWSRANSIRGR